MIPVLVAPPTDYPVTLDDVKKHCQIDKDINDWDELLQGYIASAVGHLDGWHGVLGRCLMTQAWRVSANAGKVVLPFPDVTEAIAAYSAGDASLTITETASGPCVTLTEACDVTFVCAMPAHLLPTAVVVIKQMIGHWFKVREAVGDSMTKVPMSAQTLISQMRWGLV